MPRVYLRPVASFTIMQGCAPWIIDSGLMTMDFAVEHSDTRQGYHCLRIPNRQKKMPTPPFGLGSLLEASRGQEMHLS